MAALSKRRQVEALGWRFAVVPYFWQEGVLWHNRETGEKSPARHDYEHPEAWIATPPAGSPLAERRFEGRGINAAVRWAYDQEKAPRLDADLTGVAALVALMGDAKASGVVADVHDDMDCRCRPDAELLSLCADAMGADRIADQLRSEPPDPWKERPAFSKSLSRLSEAVRTQDRLTPQIVSLNATTQPGLIAKAEIVAALFHNSSGLRSAAIRIAAAGHCSVPEDRPKAPSRQAGRIKHRRAGMRRGAAGADAETGRTVMPKQASLFDPPPCRAPQKLMHVCDAGMPGCNPDQPRDMLVHLKCGRCGHDAGWRTMGLAKSKRGVPCPNCNT